MYIISEIKYGGTLGELEQIALGRKDIDFLILQVHLELIHNLQVITGFKRRTNAGKPGIHIALALNAFIAPMSSKTMLGNIVHALSTYLHFHPLAFWA